MFKQHFENHLFEQAFLLKNIVGQHLFWARNKMSNKLLRNICWATFLENKCCANMFLKHKQMSKNVWAECSARCEAVVLAAGVTALWLSSLCDGVHLVRRCTHYRWASSSDLKSCVWQTSSAARPFRCSFNVAAHSYLIAGPLISYCCAMGG